MTQQDYKTSFIIIDKNTDTWILCPGDYREMSAEGIASLKQDIKDLFSDSLTSNTTSSLKLPIKRKLHFEDTQAPLWEIDYIGSDGLMDRCFFKKEGEANTFFMQLGGK